MAKPKKNHEPFSKRTCVLCGRPVFHSDCDTIVGATGRVVCGRCIGASKLIKTIPMGGEVPNASGMVQQVMNPSHIVKELDKAIIGQAKAKNAIAVAMWKQLYRTTARNSFPKTNLLLHGPTGCGKTAILRKASEIVDLPFLLVDTTTITENGYKGRDVREVVEELVKTHGKHPRIRNSVIFFDEFDKLAATAANDHRASYCRGTQHSLLKFVEGETVTVKNLEFNTADFLFVFGGAFTGLQPRKAETAPPKRSIGFAKDLSVPAVAPAKTETQQLEVEDFVRYGMEPELLGRIGQFVELSPLSVDDFTHILLESELSAFIHYKRFFYNEGIILTLSKEDAHAIAEKAAAKNLGARGLNTLIESLVEPMLYDFAEGRIKGEGKLELEDTHVFEDVG